MFAHEVAYRLTLVEAYVNTNVGGTITQAVVKIEDTPTRNAVARFIAAAREQLPRGSERAIARTARIDAQQAARI